MLRHTSARQQRLHDRQAASATSHPHRNQPPDHHLPRQCWQRRTVVLRRRRPSRGSRGGNSAVPCDLEVWSVRVPLDSRPELLDTPATPGQMSASLRGLAMIFKVLVSDARSECGSLEQEPMREYAEQPRPNTRKTERHRSGMATQLGRSCSVRKLGYLEHTCQQHRYHECLYVQSAVVDFELALV